ncbi:UNVERIFIED_CONTAM: hypothetical protein PYX00_000510 [Menopon gallinae]|uniref:TsaA-like domain-containing protein n=1 Tax=Menopon gallinae TaxID=328185 RepID=A0AAW2I8V9_9NEOP
MDNSAQTSELLNNLQHQLRVARNEIKNLRQQVINLKYKHKTDVEEIENVLKEFPNFKCQDPVEPYQCEFPHFHSIGKIETWFAEKRGIPRQGAICKESQGVLTLTTTDINNSSYALIGLEEFSHMWIIYHFHNTTSNHVRTKVAPPRLNGARVGVFSTRSPHRPCPIGLSLVKIDKIVENKIYFSGADMMDGTPVLDIKPYIPQYDNPNSMSVENDRKVEGAIIEEDSSAAVGCNRDAAENREAPDGEEAVKIPSWIQNAGSKKLKVEFSKKGLSQLQESVDEEKIRKTIIRVLEEDPRSVYLKGKLGGQFYTFSISDLHITCKFDDANQTVTIYQVQPGTQMCECGTPDWQCGVHYKRQLD